MENFSNLKPAFYLSLLYVAFILLGLVLSLFLPDHADVQNGYSSNCYWTSKLLPFVECRRGVIPGFFYNLWLYLIYLPLSAALNMLEAPLRSIFQFALTALAYAPIILFIHLLKKNPFIASKYLFYLSLSYVIFSVLGLIFSLFLPLRENALDELSTNCYWTNEIVWFVECGKEVIGVSFLSVFYNFGLYFIYLPGAFFSGRIEAIIPTILIYAPLLLFIDLLIKRPFIASKDEAE